nr:RES family NAD+ phosphorylase [Argonema galeatum]
MSADKYLFRIFDPTRYGTQALTFRSYGPSDRGRFDHHRGDLKNSDPDPDRSILYVGLTFECCLVEVFGDIGTVEIVNEHIARLGLKRDLTLLDLRTSSAAEQAGTVKELVTICDRALTQAWSRYFYEHPEIYFTLDGIIHLNRHNKEETVTLYERASDVLKVNWERRLDDESLRDAIKFAAERNKLTVAPY